MQIMQWQRWICTSRSGFADVASSWSSSSSWAAWGHWQWGGTVTQASRRSPANGGGTDRTDGLPESHRDYDDHQSRDPSHRVAGIRPRRSISISSVKPTRTRWTLDRAGDPRLVTPRLDDVGHGSEETWVTRRHRRCIICAPDDAMGATANA